MAVVHKAENNLRKKIKQNRLIALGAWLFFFIYIILATVNQWFLMLFTLPLFFAMGTSYFFGHKNKILSIGLEGEEKALSVVSDLTEEYHVFCNGKIIFEGQESELDLVIIGPKGIFVIEVKNYRGYIEGKEEERFWKQHKIGRKGTHYTQEFYSPVKQVGTHVYRLSKILKSTNVYTWVQGAVYFVNEDVDLSGIDLNNTPIFSLKNPLSKYLNTLEDKSDMTEEKIDLIVSILNSRIK